MDVLTEGIGYRQDGEPWERSNRPLLQWLVDNAAAEDLEIKAAIEIEWAVSAGDGDDFVSAAGGPAHGRAWLVGVSDYVRDVLDALTAEG
jgi:glutamine synthetase